MNARGSKQINCEQCKVSFKRYNSLLSKNNFCSMLCRTIWAKESAEYGSWNKGLVRTKEYKDKISQSQKENYKSGRIHHFLGKKRLEMTGENNWRWIKDRTMLKKKGDRRSSAYRDWRKQVWLRDKFKCRIADNNCDGEIEAHHILGWSEHPELRYQVNNGITLCHAHHPRKRAEEKRLIPTFMELVTVSK